MNNLRIEYVEPAEVAWLVGTDQGDLRDACEEVARLAPKMAQRMMELEVMMYPPPTTFADRVANGPWYIAS